MMSKRSEIHSSNIIGKRGILRSGKEFKGKGKGRGIVPGFRNNVSFADEERVDDLLNASQLARQRHSACLAEAALKEKKKQKRVSCGEHTKKQELDESNLDLSVESTQTSPGGTPATPIFSPRNLSHTSTPRNLSEEFNSINMSSVVLEEPSTETKNKYFTTGELAKALDDLKSLGIVAKDVVNTTEEELEGTPTTTREGVTRRKRVARKTLPSAMSDDEDGWEYVSSRDSGATTEEEDEGRAIARSVPSEFQAISSTAFDRVIQVVFQGDELLDRIREYVKSLNREVTLVDDKTLQDQYSNVEFHVCEEALKKTIMRQTSIKERLLGREKTTLGNKKAVSTCVNLFNNSKDLLGRKMAEFVSLAEEMGDEFDETYRNIHELISGHMKGAKRTPMIGN